MSDRAARVFIVIAAHVPHQGTTAKVGQRRLAKLLPKWSQSKVSRAVAELVKAGHLEVIEVGPGRRAIYHLTSPVFGQKQRDGVTEVVSAPSGGRRFASVGREIA